MGTFQDAVQWMEEGKKVTRPFYSADYGYFYIEGGNLMEYDKLNGDIICNIKLGDIKATDWEVYEEEDTWNYQNSITNDSIVYNYVNGTPRLVAIEILKEKIIDDISEIDYTNYENVEYIIKEILDKRFGF